MPRMMEMELEEYRAFQIWLKKQARGKFRLKYHDGICCRSVIHKEEKYTIHSESHRLGNSRYLVHPMWLEKYREREK